MADAEPTAEDELANCGATWYSDPRTLDYRFVDKRIVSACRLINATGWVWTAESCEGHPDFAGYRADDNVGGSCWDGNTKPMLRLVSKCMGWVFERLLAAAAYELPGEYGTKRAVFFEVYPSVQEMKYGYTEVLVYAMARNVFERDQGIAMFERFAALLYAKEEG